MKKTFFLISMVGSLVLPAVSHADTPTAPSKKSAKSSARHTEAVSAAPARQKVIFYITDTPRTGSNIPMVYRRYNNRIDSASNPGVYGQSELNRTGGIDVATELSKYDPSIVRHGGR